MQPNPHTEKKKLNRNPTIIYNKTDEIEEGRADMFYPEFKAAATQLKTPPTSPVTKSKPMMQAGNYEIITLLRSEYIHKGKRE